ncbi:MAG: dihydrodipicolinate synthase family protein [Alphaproteobacteria bacterium]|nr:dihydrodipicolinate synthase family protein [Alphaproteobacteria bacterium]
MITGLIAPALTPFNDDLSLAEDLFIAHSKWLLSEGGCSGLAPFGTTGEALSVGIEERISMLEALIANGVDPSVLIPGTGLTNLPDTARLTRHAVEQGCLGAMILPPFYFKGVSDDGIYNYYKELIGMVNHPNLRIYLYHIPQVAHVGLSIDLVNRLFADFPEVVGIKDSSGDWDNTSALLDIDGLIVYPGAELPVIEAVRRGAPGCISATANLNGVGINEVIQLCHDGKFEDAEEKHVKVKEIRLLFQDYAPIPAQKALLARWSGDARWANLRPPLIPAATDSIDTLEKDLIEQHGFR